MQGVRFPGDNNFHKDKIVGRPDKIVKMYLSMVMVSCLRHNKSRWLRFPNWSTILTPVELTRNDISCCDVMLPSAAYRTPIFRSLFLTQLVKLNVFFHSQIAISDLKRTTMATAKKGGEIFFYEPNNMAQRVCFKTHYISRPLHWTKTGYLCVDTGWAAEF